MPKFDELYPYKDEWSDVLIPGLGVVWKAKGEPQECMTCLQPTRWVETCAWGYVCSTECSEAFWQRLEDASTKIGVGDTGEYEIGF